MNMIHSLVVCVLITFLVGVGCSTMQPNAVSPSQTAGLAGGLKFCSDKNLDRIALEVGIEMCH